MGSFFHTSWFLLRRGDGEAHGQSAGGLAREFFTLLTENLFNADVGLFRYSGAGTLSYQINEASGMANGELHRQYFHFAGRVLGKALFEGNLVPAHLTTPLYKHLLGWPLTVRCSEGQGWSKNPSPEVTTAGPEGGEEQEAAMNRRDGNKGAPCTESVEKVACPHA